MNVLWTMGERVIIETTNHLPTIWTAEAEKVSYELCHIGFPYICME